MALTARLVVVSRSAMLGAGVVVLGYGAYLYLVRFGNLDPFKALKRPFDPLGANTGVRLANVRVHDYQKGRLVLSAQAGSVDITKDRSVVDLLHVKDGLYYGANGTTRFAAGKGAWNTQTQQLAISNGVRTQGKDFDLQAQSGGFDRQDGSLRVDSKISGQLYGGNFHAASLTYNMKTGDARTGAVHWQGKPPKGTSQAVDEPIVPRIWDITGETYARHHDLDVFENGRATDGEVLIIAPRVERDVHTDIVTAMGRVSYFSGKADVVADKVVVYRKEKRAVFSGNVVMLVKPKKDQDKPPVEEAVPGVGSEVAKVKVSEEPVVLTAEEKKKDEDLRSGKTIREYPLNIKAEVITYWYAKGQRRANIEGSPTAHQSFVDGRWRRGDAHDAYYDGEQDTMQLNSLPGHRDAHLKNSIGDHWEASMLKFSTKEDESEDDEDVSGKLVTGSYVDRSGEDTREPKKRVPAGPATQPPPGATGGAQGPTQGATTSKGGG